MSQTHDVTSAGRVLPGVGSICKFLILSTLAWTLFAWPPGAEAATSFADGVSQGTLNSYSISEASGLVASRQNPGVLWTHNDTGGPTLYAVSTNGQLLATWQPYNIYGGDFEDIAIGPGPRLDLDYIYLGDIGDNFLTRTTVRVIRVPEPAVYLYASNAPAFRFLGEAVEITLTYPDGPFDAEALMSDPVTGDLFIATKGANDARLYRAPKAALDTGDPITLEYQRTISFRLVSAGDISPNGGEILLRRGSRAELWKRAAGRTISQAFGTSSTQVKVIGDPTEPNGEAIAFQATGLGYYTVSEGLMQPIYYFRRTSSDAPVQPLTLMPISSDWKFYDYEDPPPPPDWFEPGFEDGAWHSGPGKLGYGQTDVQTTVDFGLDQDFKIITTYFRRAFWMGNPLVYTNITLRFLFNDGAAIYLNGTEIDRRNLEPDATFYDTATADNAALDTTWFSLPVSAEAFRPGTNVLAFELHRYNSYGPILNFDLQITAFRGTTTQVNLAGPPALADGFWAIPVVGPRGANVKLDYSTNLTRWSQLGTVTMPDDGYGIYLDPASAQRPQKYYRAHLP